MANIMEMLQLLNMARQNPQQLAATLLQQGYQRGSINRQQYELLMNQLQNGASPNQIIQQMLNSGMVSQDQFESARQSAGLFNRK